MSCHVGSNRNIVVLFLTFMFISKLFEIAPCYAPRNMPFGSIYSVLTINLKGQEEIIELRTNVGVMRQAVTLLFL